MIEITQTISATAEERELISAAESAVNSSNWIVGECASKWCEQYAAGRTDADFAELIGSSQQAVNYARRIYDRFYPHGGKMKFAWRQWKQLVAKPNVEAAIETLLTADEEGRTFENLMRIYRMQTGEPEPTTLTAADVPPKDPNETPLTQPSIRKTTPATTKQTETRNSGREVPATTQSTPAQESQPTSTGEQAEAPNTQDDADALILQALDLIGQKIDAASNGKQLAAKFRRLADKLDPPEKRERFIKPTAADIQAYSDEKGYKIDPEKFINFYESKGWVVGKAKMKSWRAAVRNAASAKDGWCNKTTDASAQTRTRDWSEFA